MPSSDRPTLGIVAALTLASASPCFAQTAFPPSPEVKAALLASSAVPATALPEAPTPNVAVAEQTSTAQAAAPAPAAQSSSSQTTDSSAQNPASKNPGTKDPVSKDPQTGEPAGPQNGPQTDNPDADAANGTHQTKRIAGVIPNYRSVSADQHLPPQTVKEKFANAGRDSFDYGSFILAAIQAGFAIEGNSYPEFGKGIVGYGRYYWRTQLDTTDENFLVGGVFPSLFHQDARFYTLGHGSFVHRALYASTRVLITRGDNGNAEPNFSEIVGAGAASGISSTYYPERYRTWTKVGQKWLTGVLIDSANFTFKEFWPDLNKRFVHQK